MNITLNSLTALRVMRHLRAHDPAMLTHRCDFVPQDPSPAQRWTARRFRDGLSAVVPEALPMGSQQLDVLVASKGQRIRTKGVSCTFRTGTYPTDAFVDLGSGIAMCGPELMFVELSRIMDPAVHLLLGMELCGRFSRCAKRPHAGAVAYDLEPVTSVDRLRAFAQEAHWVRGAERALSTIGHIVENAWSPMEALLAALIVLPADELGYDLWPIALNPRKEMGEAIMRLSDVGSRVPDIMSSGTSVGINYDGEDHFRLGQIARKAAQAERYPGDSVRERELQGALHEARARIVADKRRDRDLMTMGLTVFSATKEDLEERGGLDRLMGHVMAAIEAEGTRNLSAQRRMLRNQSRTAARQEFIWSLMPGQHSTAARQRLERRLDALGSTLEHEIEFELEGGMVKVVSIEEL